MTTKTKTRKRISKKTKPLTENLKDQYVKVHDQMIDFSEDTIEGTVENIEKWQKLLAKSIKKSTPLVEKNVDIVFDTAETILEQYRHGGQRLKSLLGWETKTYDKAPRAKKVVSDVKKTVAKVTKKATPKKVVAKVTKTATPTEAVAKAKATVTKATTVKTGDLKSVNGIGPKIETLLNEKGIYTLNDLANANIAMVQEILDKAGSRYQIHNPSTWVKQAKELAAV